MPSQVWNGYRFVWKKTRNAARQQQRRKQLLAKRGNICEQCGLEGVVEMHHKVRAVDGGGFEDSNLLLLCVPCHYKADRRVVSV